MDLLCNYLVFFCFVFFCVFVCLDYMHVFTMDLFSWDFNFQMLIGIILKYTLFLKYMPYTSAELTYYFS